MKLRDAIAYIGKVDSMGGQICQMRDGKPHLLLFEFACPHCSEVAGKSADEYGDALATIVNSAADLREAVVALLWTMNHDLAWKEEQPYRKLIEQHIATAGRALGL